MAYIIISLTKQENGKISQITKWFQWQWHFLDFRADTTAEGHLANKMIIRWELMAMAQSSCVNIRMQIFDFNAHLAINGFTTILIILMHTSDIFVT